MQESNKYKELLYYIFIVILYSLLFQNVIQRYISIFKYFDEFLAVITIPIVLLSVLKKKTLKIKKYDFFIIILLLFIGLIGLYSSFKYKYQPIYISLLDMILIYKFFLVYYLGNILNNEDKLYRYSKRITKHLKVITIIFLIFTIINYMFKVFPSSYRYGIMANTIFYGQPTSLVSSCIFLISTMIFF